eukprot:832317-Pelagomonas_calceolata.AAC.4
MGPNRSTDCQQLALGSSHTHPHTHLLAAEVLVSEPVWAGTPLAQPAPSSPSPPWRRRCHCYQTTAQYRPALCLCAAAVAAAAAVALAVGVSRAVAMLGALVGCRVAEG